MSKKKRSRASGQTGATPRDTSHNTAPSLPPCPDCGAVVSRTSSGTVALEHELTCPARRGCLRAHTSDMDWLRANPGAPIRIRALTQADADYMQTALPGCRRGDEVHVARVGGGYYLYMLPSRRIHTLMLPPVGAA